MMQRIFLWAALVLSIAILGGGIFVVYKFRQIKRLYQIPAMSEEIKTARIVSGGDRFSKETFYTVPILGVITDIRQNKRHGIVIVGLRGAAFLTEDGTVEKRV